MAKNDRSHAPLFFRQHERRARAEGGRRSDARAAGGARAARPNRPKKAAARQRRHSHHERRLAAPQRLRETRGSHEREKKSTKTTKKAQAVTDKAEAKMLPKVAVLAVEPAALCSNESSAGQLREGCRGRHATTPVPGARTCQHMLAIRHAPEVALR